VMRRVAVFTNVIRELLERHGELTLEGCTDR